MTYATIIYVPRCRCPLNGIVVSRDEDGQGVMCPIER